MAVSVQGDTLIVPGAEGNRRLVGTLQAGQEVSVTLPLLMQSKVAPGRYALTVQVTYANEQGQAFSTTEQVGITVGGKRAAPPRVLLAAVRTQPSIPAPGDVVTLTFTLTNVGEQAAERVFVSLGEGANALSGFALLGTGNVRYVPRLPANRTVEVVQHLFVAGDTHSGVYNIPLLLHYEDAEGNTFQDSQIFSLRVQQHPLLQAHFYEDVGTPLVGVPFRLPVEVTNLRATPLNVTTLEVRSSSLDIQQGSEFLGYLDGSATATLDAMAVAPAPGQHEVQVVVTYVDDFGHLAQWTHTLTVTVQAPPPTPTPAAGAPRATTAGKPSSRGGLLHAIWRFIRGLLGLGS